MCVCVCVCVCVLEVLFGELQGRLHTTGADTTILVLDGKYINIVPRLSVLKFRPSDVGGLMLP